MDNFFAPEELSNWELTSFKIDAWLQEGDSCEFVFQNLSQTFYLNVVRASDGSLYAQSISITGLDRDGNEILEKNLYLSKPEPLNVALFVESEMIEIAIEALSDWREKVEHLAQELGPIAWIPKTGRRIPDRPFVILAALFDFLQRNGTQQVIEVCSKLIGASYETTKSRIRYTRERGFLSKPGHGASERSGLTRIGKELLMEELGL